MTEDEKTIPSRVIAGVITATKCLHGQWATTPAWTKELLGSIARQADENRHYVCGIGLRAEGIGKHGEWLFDQTWYECPVRMVDGKPEFDPHRLERLTLALESEWLDGDGNHLDDFLKLAVSVAETRVMIFQSATPDTAVRSCTTMMDAARRVRTGTDADYLFACYVRSIADADTSQADFPNLKTFPFRFWRSRLQGPLVAVPPA